MTLPLKLTKTVANFATHHEQLVLLVCDQQFPVLTFSF